MFAFHLTTGANLALLLFAFLWSKRKGPLWCVTCIGAVASGTMEFAFYCPWVSRVQYEWLYQVVDANCSAADCSMLLLGVAGIECGSLFTIAHVISTAWHQLVKLQWHWAADMFAAPTGVDAYLNGLRVWSSVIVVICYFLLVYCEGSSERSSNARRRQAV